MAKRLPKNKSVIFYRFAAAVAFGLTAVFLFFKVGYSAPNLANYYLANLTGDQKQAEALAKYNVLVLTPAQIITHDLEMKAIRKANPKIIILAYVPAQSYNTKYYSNDPIFKNLVVPNTSWLKDGSGRNIFLVDNVKMINLDSAWSEYYAGFIKDKITSLPQVDGVFLDMVDGSISWLNGGDIDLDGDGFKDNSARMDDNWLDRTVYLLKKINQIAAPRYLVINGSSKAGYQPYVNGRMYENFPTPWEEQGDWGRIMNVLKNNQPKNRPDHIVIFNANTNNTGEKNDYQKMRFGLASSLMLDNIYYSFDYGDRDHGQLWWYDEFGVDLGKASASAVSVAGDKDFKAGVWKREYEKGIAILNSGNLEQLVDLGADYEKITGAQAPQINSGLVVDKINLAGKDGVLMLKTAQKISKVPFKNGDFLRFYFGNGNRARNGFFADDSAFTGGAKVYRGDLDGKGDEELIVINGSKVEIYNALGQRWLSHYPFGGGFKGEINVAVGKLYGSPNEQILLAPSTGGRVELLDYHGNIIAEDFYPLGEKYKGGFSVGIGNVDPADFWGEALFGSNQGEVLVYDYTLSKLKKKIKVGSFGSRLTQIAVGDFDGSGTANVAVTDSQEGKNISVWNYTGKKVKEFPVSLFLGSSNRRIYASDVNYDGKDEIVIMSAN